MRNDSVAKARLTLGTGALWMLALTLAILHSAITSANIFQAAPMLVGAMFTGAGALLFGYLCRAAYCESGTSGEDAEQPEPEPPELKVA